VRSVWGREVAGLIPATPTRIITSSDHARLQ